MKLNPSLPLKQHPLAFFFILAYGLAWIPLALQLAFGEGRLVGVASFAPALSAILLVVVTEGETGTRGLLSQLFLWRTGYKWYLLALLAPLAVELAALPLHQLTGHLTSSLDFGEWLPLLPAQLPGLVLGLVFLVVLAAGEELGWRGYALPRLQARYGGVGASLLLGLLWGGWHLPLFGMPGTLQYGLPAPGFILATIGYAVIYTCLYNGTQGSVLLASVYHAASNLTLLYGNALFPTVINNLYVSLPALALVVLGVIGLSGSSAFAGTQSIRNQEVA